MALGMRRVRDFFYAKEKCGCCGSEQLENDLFGTMVCLTCGCFWFIDDSDG